MQRENEGITSQFKLMFNAAKAQIFFIMLIRQINCNSLGHPRYLIGAIDYNALTKAQQKALNARVRVTKGRKGTVNEYCYILTTFLSESQIHEIINNAK